MREDESLLFFCLVLIALARAGAVSPVAFATAPGPLVSLAQPGHITSAASGAVVRCFRT
jgi:hypothetical protein